MVRVDLIKSLLLATAYFLCACSAETGGSRQPGNGPTPEQASSSRASARQRRAAIDKRAAHGLDHMHFEIKGTSTGRPDGTALTNAALAYAAALARGAADPTKLYAIYALPRSEPDLRQGLADAIQKGNVGKWLESLAPQDPTYRKL